MKFCTGLSGQLDSPVSAARQKEMCGTYGRIQSMTSAFGGLFKLFYRTALSIKNAVLWAATEVTSQLLRQTETDVFSQHRNTFVLLTPLAVLS
jgi:hypothetical protein